MEPFGTGLSSNNLGGMRSAESDALTREILQHQEEDKNRSYLSRFVVGLTEFAHGNDKSLERMDALRQKAMLASMTGDAKTADGLRKEMSNAVSSDKDSRKSADSWSSHTGNFAKSLGLFFPGAAGYTVAALANAADSAHPNDSLLRQSVDGVLGASKGAAMKYGFDRVGQSEMNLALKAGTLSISNRFAEVGLNSHTYFNEKTGDLDLAGGLWKTGKAVADPHQLGMDMLTFGGGYLLLNKLGVTPEFAKANPMLAQTLTGAGFGFSSGFFADVQMQKKLGDGFDITSALKNGFIQMGLDGTAAAIGGYRMQQMRTGAASPELAAPKEAVPTHTARLDMSQIEGVFGLDPRPVARRLDAGPVADDGVSIAWQKSDAVAAKPAADNATKVPAIARDLNPQGGAGIREFVSKESVSDLLATLRTQGANAQALLRVQEVLPGAKQGEALGPEQTMLIKHVEPGMKMPEVARSADLLATCDPKLLEALGIKDIGQRHLFPDAGSSQVLLQVPGSNRLRFSLPDALKASGYASEPAIPLGGKEAKTAAQPKEFTGGDPRDPFEHGPYTLSSLLRRLDINDNISNVHSIDGRLGIDEIANAMQKVKLPAERIIGGGGDSIIFELTDGNILKVTDRPWNPDWGTRTIDWRGQQVRMDARILGTPQQIKVGDQTITYYTQQKGITPVSRADAWHFDELVDRDGKYIFWDKDHSDMAHGPDQLAYVPLQKFQSGLLTAIPIADPVTGRLTRGLALIDFDAVRVFGTEPKFPSGGDGRNSWRFGRYDFSPFER